MYNKITLTLRHFTQSLRLMVGMPEYSTYVDHMKSTHPDRAIMTYEEFFRERQEARYGGERQIKPVLLKPV